MALRNESKTQTHAMRKKASIIGRLSREGLRPLWPIILVLTACFGCAQKQSENGGGRPALPKDLPGTERFCDTAVAANRVLVKFRRTMDPKNRKSLEQIAAKITDDLVTVEPVGNGEVFLVQSQTGRSVEALNSSFQKQQFAEIVEYAEPDYLVQVDCPNPSIGSNPDIDREWGLDKIDACSAWDSYDQPDAIVAVIDTGINCAFTDDMVKCHPDLQANIWLPDGLTVKLGGREIKCERGCFGFDATMDDSSTDPNKWRPTDSAGHGTQVSGIIAAANNDKGIVGVSFKNKVLAIKYADVLGYGFVSSIKRAIDFVIAAKQREPNIRIVNCSFGFDPTKLPACDALTLKQAFEQLDHADVLIVSSSGDGKGAPPPAHPHYPSGYDLTNQIAVTATNQADDGCRFNFDPRAVNLIGAPGEKIFTTETSASGFGQQPGGTSFSAAFVSGAAALILSNSANHCGRLTTPELKKVIMESADHVPDLMKFILDGKRLNVGRAVTKC